MENLTIILIGSVVFCFITVLLVMLFIGKVAKDQRRRQRQIVDQAKLNSNLQESVDTQDKVIQRYKSIIGF